MTIIVSLNENGHIMDIYDPASDKPLDVLICEPFCGLMPYHSAWRMMEKENKQDNDIMST